MLTNFQKSNRTEYKFNHDSAFVSPLNLSSSTAYSGQGSVISQLENSISVTRNDSSTPLSEDDYERDERQHMLTMRTRIRNFQSEDYTRNSQGPNKALAEVASQEITEHFTKVLLATRAAKKHDVIVDVDSLSDRCREIIYAEEPARCSIF